MKVKKMFRSSVAIIMTVCVLIQTSSAFGEVKSCEYTQTEIIIRDDIDKVKAQLIIDTINGEDIISPRSILCILGHSLSRTTVVETNHRFYSTSPRCRSVTYDVEYCVRSGCNHIIYTIITDKRIVCC